MLLAGKIVRNTASAATSTWNPSDKGANITLSNGDRTATTTTGAGQVRGASGKTTGKFYFEVTATVNSLLCIGVSGSSASLSAKPGGLASVALQANGVIYFAGNSVVLCSGFSNGNVVGVAVDADNRTVDFYVNGVLQGSVSQGNCPTGALFPAFGASVAGEVGVLNTGSSAFSSTPPEGYSAWG